jgi:hypothetical protein
MTLPTLDRAVLVGRLAQIAQPEGAYDSKTDQTAQSDQRIEIADEFGAFPDQKPTSLYPKLTSGTAQRPRLGARGLGRRIRFEHARPSDRAQA